MIALRIIGMLSLILLLTSCKQQDLLEGLTQQQANEILAVLKKNYIMGEKFSTGKDGYTVSVNNDDFPAAVELMRIYGLPSRPDIEISQLFPSDSLVSSPIAEKARLYSGIEQRLEQSVKLIAGVYNARIHVSYDGVKDTPGKKENKMHVSALVIYNPDTMEPSEQKIASIKRFLKNSFSEVEYNDISVVLTPASIR
ncbi:type III secretion system inner membrane ring lipoprotein SctJ [Citrobacter sp. wls826]|uniref:type III secretion system inner membrane ring lipoprotein SctJ n=1 Tax=Citrobacter sp. wls826 TaxID=2576415 RepID=UPI001484FD1E|nr:type III secretion inner membrane ring lipoprotein SctJ [Citrobacter sp. wls826]